MEPANNAPTPLREELSGYLRETAEALFRLSQDCMDLRVAERLRTIATDMQRQSSPHQS